MPRFPRFWLLSLILSVSAFAQDLRQLKSEFLWKTELNTPVREQVAVSNDGKVLYCVGLDSVLSAVTLEGEVLWTTTIGKRSLLAMPVVAYDHQILVTSWDGRLYAVSPDGQINWHFQTKYGLRSAPAVSANGVIYLAAADHHLYALNMNGELLWKKELDHSVISSPAIARDGTVYIGTLGGSIYAMLPSGKIKWKRSLEGGIEASPTLDHEGRIFVRTADGLPANLDLPSMRMTFGDKEDLFQLYCLNPDGGIVYVKKTQGGGEHCALINQRNHVAVLCDSGLFSIYMPERIQGRGTRGMTGSPVNALACEDGIYNFPIQWNKLQIELIDSRCPRHVMRMNTEVTGTPVLLRDSVLVCGSSDGSLYAYKLNVGPDTKGAWPKEGCDLQNRSDHTQIGFETPPHDQTEAVIAWDDTVCKLHPVKTESDGISAGWQWTVQEQPPGSVLTFNDSDKVQTKVSVTDHIMGQYAAGCLGEFEDGYRAGYRMFINHGIRFIKESHTCYSYAPRVLDNNFLVKTDYNTMALMDTRGNVKWSYNAGDYICPDPYLMPDGSVYAYVQGRKGTELHVLDREGKIQWIRMIKPFDPKGGRSNFYLFGFSPDKSSIFKFCDIYLAVDAQGRIMWQIPHRELHGRKLRDFFVTGSCAGIYTLKDRENLVQVRGIDSTGKQLRFFDLPGSVDAFKLGRDGFAYTIENRSTLSKYDLSTGLAVWRQQMGDAIRRDLLVSRDGEIFMTLTSGAVVKLNQNGALLWRYQGDDNFKPYNLTLSRDGYLVCIDRSRKLIVLDRQGQYVQSCFAAEDVKTGCTISEDGTIIVLSGQYQVMGFGSPCHGLDNAGWPMERGDGLGSHYVPIDFSKLSHRREPEEIESGCW